MSREDVLITPAELSRLIEAGEPVTILDVRWRLDAPDGRAAYTDGHIPGAVYVSLDDELSDHSLAGRGRHPLPSGSSVQGAARRWGVRRDGLVVAYDDFNRMGSGRAWWVLTAAGLSNVRILDGGLGAWRSAGGRIESGPVHPEPGNVTVLHDDLYAGALPTLTAEQAGSASVPLFDARAPERYRGDSESVDAAAGHIPGAKNLPFGTLLSEDGSFQSDAVLADLLSSHGIEPGVPVGAYCGSGVSATVIVAALAAAGHETAMFPGSWSEWSSDPSRPVARGDG